MSVGNTYCVGLGENSNIDKQNREKKITHKRSLQPGLCGDISLP